MYQYGDAYGGRVASFHDDKEVRSVG